MYKCIRLGQHGQRFAGSITTGETTLKEYAMADVHAETVAWMDESNVKDIFEVCHNMSIVPLAGKHSQA